MRARELMSTPVVTVRPEATLKEVAEQMAARGISGVPVVDRFGHLAGIVSETDLLTRLEHVEHGEKRGGLLSLLAHIAGAAGVDDKLEGRTAAEIMTPQVVMAGPDASFRELVHLMTVHAINRIPIVESDRVIGIVTRADLLRTLVRPDAATTADVRWRILHDLWIDPTNLTISTRDGIVTVKGEVGTRTEADLVRQWVAAAEGVFEVDTRSLRYRLDDRHVAASTGPPREFEGHALL